MDLYDIFTNSVLLTPSMSISVAEMSIDDDEVVMAGVLMLLHPELINNVTIPLSLQMIDQLIKELTMVKEDVTWSCKIGIDEGMVYSVN